MTGNDPLFHIALHEPQIPQNTGNIGRLSLALGARLHLVGRLGFQTDERACRRAGLDYWQHVDCVEHADLKALRAALPEGAKIVCFSTRAERPFTDVSYQPGDCLLFGGEVRGLPQDELDAAGALAVRIPLRSTKVRSLNLANSAAIGAAEVLRQLGYPETIAPRPPLPREQECTQS